VADVLQLLGLEVDEGVGAQTQRGVAVVGASCADHLGAHRAGQLHGDRADAARGAVDEDALPGLEVGMAEQGLPGGESGDGQRGGRDVVDVGGQRGEVAGFDRGVLGQGAVAGPVGQAVHALPDGQAGGAVAEFGDDAGQFVAGHTRGPIASGPVGPGAGPVQLARREAGGVDLHDHVVLCGVRVGQLGKGQAACTGLAVLDGDGLHEGFLRGREVGAGVGRGGHLRHQDPGSPSMGAIPSRFEWAICSRGH
jgi:hypothetical protein